MADDQQQSAGTASADASTPMTPAEMLGEVNNAIVSVLSGGQSYKIGSRQLSRANLSELYALRKDLAAQVAESTPGLFDDCYVAVFDRR